MKLLVIDNYDSFTFNLVQFLQENEAQSDLTVVRNDEWTMGEVRDFNPDAIVISPGPGTPKDAGISVEVIRNLGTNTPVLGVCLGHQCIADAYGGSVVSADRLLHGKTSEIHHGPLPVYNELPDPFEATRYHSLIVSREDFPEELTINAVSEHDEIMGLHHREHPVVGVQFHPESILTEDGRRFIGNFLDFALDPEPLGNTNYSLKLSVE